MPEYYVSKAELANGDHEVHTADCEHLPAEGKRIYLGTHSNGHLAVAEAQRFYSKVNGCSVCSAECHKG
jgi:hypothetical protein